MNSHPDLSDPDELPAPHLRLDAANNTAAAPVTRGLVGEPAPVLEEAELYKYKYLRERAQNQHLVAQHHARAHDLAMVEQERVGAELGQLLDALGAKYKVDLHTHTITENGTVVPMPLQR